MQQSPRFFLVPGLGSSGPDHWQTYFERSGAEFVRIEQREWDAPARADWVAGIEAALTGHELGAVVLIGHSLGCATIAHWAAYRGQAIRGALLVAPSDLEAPQYTFPATGFAPIPLHRLPFPSTVVASTDDPWVSLARAKYFAAAWGSELVNIGPAGHINAASGYGEWPAGLDLLDKWR